MRTKLPFFARRCLDRKFRFWPSLPCAIHPNGWRVTSAARTVPRGGCVVVVMMMATPQGYAAPPATLIAWGNNQTDYSGQLNVLPGLTQVTKIVAGSLSLIVVRR